MVEHEIIPPVNLSLGVIVDDEVIILKEPLEAKLRARGIVNSIAALQDHIARKFKIKEIGIDSLVFSAQCTFLEVVPLAPHCVLVNSLDGSIGLGDSCQRVFLVFQFGEACGRQLIGWSLGSSLGPGSSHCFCNALRSTIFKVGAGSGRIALTGRQRHARGIFYKLGAPE